MNLSTATPADIKRLPELNRLLAGLRSVGIELLEW